MQQRRPNSVDPVNATHSMLSGLRGGPSGIDGHFLWVDTWPFWDLQRVSFLWVGTKPEAVVKRSSTPAMILLRESGGLRTLAELSAPSLFDLDGEIRLQPGAIRCRNTAFNMQL
jgi:hypothetical protein